MINNQTVFTKDLANKKLLITRAFDASIDLVWKAWTESEILDQWWAPKPFVAKTKTMDFREGGFWLYCMVGPEGENPWCKETFKTISPYKYIINEVIFCDADGNENVDLPTMHWTKQFSETNGNTTVNVEITFHKIEDLKTIISMGFKEGFEAGLGNLDLYLSTKFKLRKEFKTNNNARVTTYLNFPGTTEQAFNFYKEVFNGEFTGVKLQRFGDIEMPLEAPPLDEQTKKLIIHAELTIMGGHVLMATDSPESMGFKMKHGNNMHINIEPSTKEETKRLFDTLSAGGIISMPLADMFWGGYFASFTDRFGINWMLNYQLKED